jgi:hypothetical protein
MSDSVRINITATDNASKVFGAVGGAASKMGSQLDDVGDAFRALTKDYGMTEAAARDLLASQGMVVTSLDKVDTAATDAARSVAELEPALNDAATAAETTGRSLRDMDSELRNIGLGIGVLATGAALAGQSFRDQQIVVDSLRRTYGEAADGLIDFANELQNTTNFSNDAAMAAIDSFGTLARNYDLNTQQIRELTQASADLAAVKGIGLVDAATRVQAAIRGEAESAEYLGLTMNQMAIDHDNVTFSMSNAEAGAFRFNAVMDQSAFAMGAAADQADTTYGSMVDLRDGVQDAAQSFGEFLGPVGEVGAFMADNAIQFAAAGLALTQLGKAAVATRTVMMSLAATHTSVALLGTALGPVGLVAAAGLAGVGILKLADALHTSYAEAAEAAIEETQELKTILEELGTSDPAAILGKRMAAAFDVAIEASENYRSELAKLEAERAKAEAAMQTPAFDQAEFDREFARLEMLDAQIAALKEQQDQIELTKQELQAFTDAEQAYADVLENTGPGRQNQLNAIQASWDLYKQEIITLQDFAETVELVASRTENYNALAQEQIYAQQELESHMSETARTAADQAESYSELATQTDDATDALNALKTVAMAADAPMKAIANWLVNGVEAGEEFAESTEQASDAIDALRAVAEAAEAPMVAIANWFVNGVEGAEEMATAIMGAAEAMSALQTAGTAAIPWLADMLVNGVDNTEAAEALAEMYKNLGEALDEAGESAGAFAENFADIALAIAQDDLVQAFEAVTAGYTATTTAMENSFRVIVGNTNAIASQSESINDWSSEISHAVDQFDEWGNYIGTWSTLDSLVSQNVITQGEYNAALDAHNQIWNANLSIQEDVLSIQAQQAPVIAAAAEAQAEYLEGIEHAGTAQQTLALAYMDSATAAQALSLAQAYIADTDTFGPMLESAANLDPFLAAILTDMGLIAQQEDKTWKVIAQPEGMSEVELLTDAVSSLEDTIVSIFVEVDDSELVAMDQMLQESGLPGGGGLVGGGGGGRNIVVTLTAETADADAKIDATTGKLTTWDGATGTGDVLAVNTDAVSKIQLASGNLDTWDASSGNAAIEASDNASGKIASVSGALSALNGKTATTYINTVYTTTYQTVGSPGGMFFGHGGVVDNYATGGVVAEMGEWGPEMLHFPNGGVAMARTPGIYSVPQGTYVDTAPATAAKVQSLSGGINVTINVAGSVGVDDLTEQVTRQLVPALQRAASQHMRSYGL